MGNAADKKRLRSVAKMLREELRHNAEDTPIHCWRRLPLRPSNTDGWFVVLAGLGRGRPKLQLWLDHYAERRERRFWFGFYSPHPKGLRQRIRRLPHYLQPVREFSSNDVEHVGKDNWLLAIPLKRMDFSRPIFEYYSGGHGSYFGKFDPSAPGSSKSSRLVVRRAAAFFEDVISALPKAKPSDRNNEVYPQFENRKIVRQHIAHERSSTLAVERKIQDDYRCQVCQTKFEEVYGEIGREFAEAHHKIPLSRLKGKVLTSLKDLITVCANCHRMLHKLPGKLEDVAVLKRKLRNRR